MRNDGQASLTRIVQCGLGQCCRNPTPAQRLRHEGVIEHDAIPGEDVAQKREWRAVCL